MNAQVPIDREKIADFCRRNGIRELALFGSVLRDDFGPDSDVDVLYEFQPGHFVGFGILAMEAELSLLLGGRKVDLVPKKYLNRWMRARVLASAETIYAEG